MTKDSPNPRKLDSLTERLKGQLGGKLTGFILLVLAPILAVYLYIQWKYPTDTLRYRLTIEVQTPEGVRTGSSAIETTREEHIQFLPEVGVVTWRVTGEAVFVDLGGGKNLVVTLTNSASGRKKSVDAAWLPFSDGPDIKSSPYRRHHPARWNEVVELGTRTIELNRLPTIVTFSDVSDPKSVELVDPHNLLGTFGAGHALKQARIQVTRDRMEETILRKIPALTNWTWDEMGPQGTTESMDLSRFWHAIAFSFKKQGGAP